MFKFTRRSQNGGGCGNLEKDGIVGGAAPAPVLRIGAKRERTYGISVIRLFFATWKRTESAPTITHGVAWRDTIAPYIVCAPVRRPLPRMCTMLGGKFGSDLPPIATPTPCVGTRTTRLVRLAPSCTLIA